MEISVSYWRKLSNFWQLSKNFIFGIDAIAFLALIKLRKKKYEYMNRYEYKCISIIMLIILNI